jgi:hypothetical protein
MKALGIVCLMLLSLSIDASAEESSSLGKESVTGFKLAVDYAPGLTYKGKPVVRSIFNTYDFGSNGPDSLIIREDFENLFVISNANKFVSPYGLSKVTLSSTQEKSLNNALRLRVLEQAQAGRNWGNALSCSFIFRSNGREIPASKIDIDFSESLEDSPTYPELRGLPGLGSYGAGGRLDGKDWSSSESWFESPISFYVDTRKLDPFISEDSPDGPIIGRFDSKVLPSEFKLPGKVSAQYGLECTNAIDPSFNFKSIKSVVITIMPKLGSVKFSFDNPQIILLNEKAIEIDVASPNESSQIVLKSLSPSICAGFATSVLLKNTGVCRIQITQGASEDYSKASQEFEFKIVKSVTCIKGKNTKKILGVNPKCPKGYKKGT